MHLIATKAFDYRGRALNPGDRFEASDFDGRMFRDGLDPKAIDDPKPDLLSRAMTTTSAAPLVKEPRRSGRYGRRDMRAES